MQQLISVLHQYVGPDLGVALVIILNLILIESLLSVDNAAVLATLVRPLPVEERARALRIGVFFAYLFRGLALVFAGVLVRFTWLKLLGGGYLLYLCLHFFWNKQSHPREIAEEEAVAEQKINWIENLLGIVSPFWRTVFMVEAMDLVFSIDNVFAAVAFTENIYLVCIGVFIGIIAMRLVANYFVWLMERFPFLDTLAFVVIGLLGLKLVAEFLGNTVFPEWQPILQHEAMDAYFSAITASVFFAPVLYTLAFKKR
ncbi:MAG: DUF475 domain-containing protein [Chitinophagales bacterium]